MGISVAQMFDAHKVIPSGTILNPYSRKYNMFQTHLILLAAEQMEQISKWLISKYQTKIYFTASKVTRVADRMGDTSRERLFLFSTDVGKNIIYILAFI